MKTFIDADARVVGYSADFKLEGAMGALECEMPVTGVRFKIGRTITHTQHAHTYTTPIHISIPLPPSHAPFPPPQGAQQEAHRKVRGDGAVMVQ